MNIYKIPLETGEAQGLHLSVLQALNICHQVYLDFSLLRMHLSIAYSVCFTQKHIVTGDIPFCRTHKEEFYLLPLLERLFWVLQTYVFISLFFIFIF